MVRRIVQKKQPPPPPPAPKPVKLSALQNGIVLAMRDGRKLFHAQLGHVRGVRTTQVTFGVVLARTASDVEQGGGRIIADRVLRALLEKGAIERVEPLAPAPHPLAAIMAGQKYAPREVYRLAPEWRKKP